MLASGQNHKFKFFIIKLSLSHWIYILCCYLLLCRLQATAYSYATSNGFGFLNKWLITILSNAWEDVPLFITYILSNWFTHLYGVLQALRWPSYMGWSNKGCCNSCFDSMAGVSSSLAIDYKSRIYFWIIAT